MASYLIRRLAMALGLALLVLTVVFILIRAVPGDAAVVLASGGADGTASPEAIEQMRTQLGLDKPLGVQYVTYLRDVVTGGMGTSFFSGESVGSSILERLPTSLELVLSAVVLGSIPGITLGAFAARRGGWVDTAVSAFSSAAVSVPAYVISIMLIYTVALQLHWLPAGGLASWSDPAARLSSMVLPVVAIAIPLTGTVARMTRASIAEVQHQDWVRTASSWGLKPFPVFMRHILRNALTPIVTVIGMEIGLILGSTVLVERVFAYPGIGSLLIEGINYRDYPVIQGVVVTIALVFILLNVLVDIVYGILDPRVRR